MLKHKLMEAMFQRELTQPLQGVVLIDDAYLGGERTGGKAGRGSEDKVPFVVAVGFRDGRPPRALFDRVKAFSFDALRDWHGRALAPGTQAMSGDLLGFQVLRRDGFLHQQVTAPRGKAGTEIEPFRWLNTILGNLKTAPYDTRHAFAFQKLLSSLSG